MRLVSFLVLSAALGACGDDGQATPDGAIDAPAVDMMMADANLMPMTLAETGLCANAACTQVMADVHEYAPQFVLYTDGATKKRWIKLPAGTTIDTADMNFWKFPVGTQVWKEFTRDGTRVETRYMRKLLADDTAPGAWFYAAYAWNATQDATTLAPPSTGVTDANGTQHDIPTRSQCRRCHEGQPGRVLGFGAISLDHTAPAGVMDLDDAIAANMLSAPPSGTTPRFPLPGATLDHDALGYLHANCGHCHNPMSPTFSTTPLQLRLDTTKLATIQVTPVYTTAYNVAGTVGGLTDKIIKPNDAAGSVMIIRFESTLSPPKMPELGTEVTDAAADTLLKSWIPTLPNN